MEQRVIKIHPYSYSSLTSFETCARKHYGERLSKEFARPFNKAANDGDIWHKQAEQYALDGTPIPDSNPHRAKMMEVIDELNANNTDGTGQFHAELELCVDREKNPVSWWDSTGYTRAKLDIAYIEPTEAWSIDWKTGKADVFSTQLKHSALLLFLHYPNLQKVHTRYEWLKEKFATKATVHREFFDAEWAKFENRMSKYEAAFNKNQWPEKKSGLCKNYCGVTTCVHNGNFRTDGGAGSR